jgi:hypothetical protein
MLRDLVTGNRHTSDGVPQHKLSDSQGLPALFGSFGRATEFLNLPHSGSLTPGSIIA